MNNFNTLIFDFDYTLADSSEAVIECVNYAFDKLGLPRQDPISIKKTIGRSLPETFEMFTGHCCSQTVAEFRKYFREKADQVMTAKTRMFEYVPGVLEELTGNKLRLAIVSLKFRFRIMEILERENLTNYFSLILGGENVSQNKPHPEGLLKAVKELGEDKQRILYIGDSTVDAEAAERAGVPYLAVLSGATEKDGFSGFNPVGFISDLRELANFLGISA